jgi:hypothetical protein
MSNLVNGNQVDITFSHDRPYRHEPETRARVVADVREFLNQRRFRSVVGARIR